MSKDKEKKHKLLSWPKILMILGSIWIIAIGIASSIGDFSTSIFGSSYLTKGAMIAIGVLFILIPLSVKPDMWSTIWAIIITLLCVAFFIGYFVGGNTDFTDPALYLSIAPYLLMGVGSLAWIFWND